MGDERVEEQQRAVWMTATAKALDKTQTWMRRRRETLEFSSPTFLTRTVELDFAFPDVISQAFGDAPHLLIIGFIPQEQTGTVRVSDEAGSALPAFSSVESARLLYEALAGRLVPTQSDSVAGWQPWPSDIAVKIMREAVADPTLLATPQESRSPENQRERIVEALRADPFVTSLLGVLCSSYPLVVELPAKPVRRVLTYVYEDTVSRDASRLRETFGWTETRAVIVVPGVALAASHEFAVEAPESVIITHLRILSSGPSRSSQIETGAWGTGRFVRSSVDNITPIEGLEIEVRLQPDRAYPLAVLFTALAVAIVLTAGWVRLSPLSRAPEAAAAVLLAVPALFTTIIAQPVRGTPAAQLLTGARFILVLTGILAYTAALMLVLYPDTKLKVSSVLDVFWPIAVGTAWLLFAFLVLPVISPAWAERDNAPRAP